MKFLTNEPALLADTALIISDLHIGIEHEFFRSGINIPSQTGRMKKRLERLLRTTKAKKLFILGDVKHQVPGISFQEMREIPEFLNYFTKKVSLEIVMGNHDPGLERLVPNIKIHPSLGILFADLYLTHGHTWPDKKFLKAKTIVIGHIQPQIEFRERLGYAWREPVWVKAKLDQRKIGKKYGLSATKKTDLPELIILPAFNSFSGGYAVNKKEGDEELLGPVMKCADLKNAELFLLDGTFLGKLKNLK